MTNDRQQRAARAEQMRKEREKADRKQRNLITIAIVVVVIVLIALAGWGISQSKKENDRATALTTPKNVTKDYGIVYTPEIATGKAPAKGSDPVRVTIYEDFLCPTCGAFEQASGPFLDEQVKKGEVMIDYRPFAFLANQSTNRYSQRAWNLAACVVDKGGPKAFNAVHQILFANQPQEGGAGPEDDALLGFAKEAGVTGIDSCVAKETFTPWIEDALDQGQEDKVGGTPTVRVDGKDVKGPGDTIPGPKELQAAITAAKKR